jgi:hypothetical protein
MTRTLTALAACAAIISLLGCGAARSTPHATHRRTHPAGTAIVSIPGLGSLSYGCAGARGVVATLSTQGASASETATVEGDDGRHLRAATLTDPGGPGLTVPAAGYRTLTWRVIQSTEPSTVEATVRISFSGEKNRRCTLRHWSSDVKVIGHQGPWSPPKAWP